MLDILLAADAALLRQIVSWPHPDWLNWVFLAASRVGIGGAIWVATGLLLFVTRRIAPVGFLRLLIAILLVHVVVDLTLKPLVHRPRPPYAIAGLHVVGDTPRTASFPSGHAANAIAGALVLAALVRKKSARAIIWTAAAVVGVARVYLGVHYPLDATAGALVGALCGAAAMRIPLPQGPPEATRATRTNETTDDGGLQHVRT
jgi:undecaprenyl-diphosphatase